MTVYWLKLAWMRRRDFQTLTEPFNQYPRGTNLASHVPVVAHALLRLCALLVAPCAAGATCAMCFDVYKTVLCSVNKVEYAHAQLFHRQFAAQVRCCASRHMLPDCASSRQTRRVGSCTVPGITSTAPVPWLVTPGFAHAHLQDPLVCCGVGPS
ncbi:hypothetical protein BKA62DRAFT_184871 [Auriculariales sp. MPI-PUGE-AT-0066]|nr:hypothetical protein BKA62DRAFT_184871 [Auriculariales sp. MPI-PUGE-AT-0066]